MAKVERVEKPLVGELAAYDEQFERLKRDLPEALQGLGEARCQWRPYAGAWSVVECIEHLNVTGRHALKMIDGMIAEARARGLYNGGPYRHGLIGQWLLWLIEPPYRLKVKAVKVLQPERSELSLEQVTKEYLRIQDEMQARLRAANGLDLTRVKATLPTHVTLDLGQWFGMVTAHQRRHLWQIRQIVGRPDFPR